jgi:hypothetical protein
MIHSSRSKSVTPRVGWHQAQFNDLAWGIPRVSSFILQTAKLETRDEINGQLWIGFHALRRDMILRKFRVLGDP